MQDLTIQSKDLKFLKNLSEVYILYFILKLFVNQLNLLFFIV